MKQLKVFGLALMAILAVGVMTAASASAALALPQIAAGPGQAYPLNLGGHLTVASLLRTEGGSLTGKEFSVLLSAAEPTALGSAAIEFLGVEEPSAKKKCNTPGDSEANGAVLLLNAEYHLIFFNFAPLELGALTLFTKLLILCNVGALETTTTPPSTTRITVPAPNAAGEISSLQITSHCATITTDLQEIPYYYADSGSLEATTLLANISGTGLKKSCELIEGTTLLTPETGSSANSFTVLW
jgi:hypothetical protein